MTDADRQQVRELHAQGHGRNEISRRTGLAEGTVGNIARALGLSFERNPGAIAGTAARSEDLKARRLAIQDRILRRAEKMLDRLDADEWQTILRGSEGREHEASLAFIPARDERDAAWTLGSYLAQERELEKVNGNSGEDDARSMLVGLLRDVQGAWRLAQQQEAAVDFDDAEQAAPAP